MAYSSNIVKTKRDGIVRLISDDPTTYICNFAVGDFSFEGVKSDLLIIRDRATIAGARKGDDQPVTFSFSCHLRALSDGTADVLLDFVYGKLSGSSLATTGPTGYEPFLCTVEFEMSATPLGDSKIYKAQFLRCQLIASVTEGDPNNISISGTALGGVVYT